MNRKEILVVTVIRSYPLKEITNYLRYELTVPSYYKDKIPKQIIPDIITKLRILSFNSERPIRDTRRLVDKAIKAVISSTMMKVKGVKQSAFDSQHTIHNVTYYPDEFGNSEHSTENIALRYNKSSILLKIVHCFEEDKYYLTQDLGGVFYSTRYMRREDGKLYTEINTIDQPYRKPLIAAVLRVDQLDAVREDDTFSHLVAINSRESETNA